MVLYAIFQEHSLEIHAMQKKFTVTAISTTDAIATDGSNRYTFAAVGDASDYTIDVQVRLTDDGNWFTAQAAMVDGEIYAAVAGARAIRFDITALGAATTIDIEVTGANL